MTTTDNNQPPHKRTAATIINYDSDQLMGSPLSPQTGTSLISSNGNSTMAMTPTVMTPNAYAMELLSLKQEIAQLKTTIATAVEQITKAIASLHEPQRLPRSNDMDTESETTSSTNTTTTQSQQLDLPAIISELKNNIATINNKMQALFNQYVPPQSTNINRYSSAT